tara:strand:+ start:439 stop:918 length:480 start_codon:yes stop_codon:yes gene_type:complete
MSDYIKFVDNKSETVTLLFDEPLEGTNQFGKKQYTYGIKELISGEEKFSATEKLHEKIQGLGASKGDTLTIEKVKDADINKGFAFFKVEMADNPAKKDSAPTQSKPLHDSVKKFEKQFEPKEDKMAMHELSMRIEKLEKIVAALWEKSQNEKKGDDLPF